MFCVQIVAIVKSGDEDYGGWEVCGGREGGGAERERLSDRGTWEAQEKLGRDIRETQTSADQPRPAQSSPDQPRQA